MSSTSTILSIVLAVAGASQTIPSPPASKVDDLQIRINGPIHIAAGDTASAVWVINHNATIDGVVAKGLGVINGTARITGSVVGGVVVVNGQLELAPGARVGGDVMLYRSTMTRANDAVIVGAVNQEKGFSVGAGAIWLVWLSFTIVVLLAGLVFMELAPTTLTESVRQLSEHRGQSVWTAFGVAAAVPGLAFVSFATVIGIPLGLTLLFVVIPALTFLGYLVAGAALGSALGTRLLPTGDRSRRFAPIVIGLVTLQVVTGLPVIGGLVGFLASLVGVGALVARTWSRHHPVVTAGLAAPAGA